jgi:DNA-binding response OmpR family regulator
MNILIIDNSTTLSHIMKKTLEAYNYRTTLDRDHFATENLIKEGKFEIVILNTSLPKEQSFSILKSIKEISPRIKVLGVCKREGWKNRVRFLQEGADDVLTYPFPMQELLARIQCLNRRPKSYDSDKLCLSNIEIDTSIRSATKDNLEVPLRKQEYSLFEYLLRNKNRTVTRYELMDHVWDYRKFNNSNTIDVHVKRLRDKLGNRNLIQTVHGVGYRIVEKEPKASSALRDG